MDCVTEKVMDMYKKYPYPSPEAGRDKLQELAYLLKIFSLENGIDLTGKDILDAGTGTGHRLVQAAKAFPKSNFTAVDYCSASLDLAKKLAATERLVNVTHSPANLMENIENLGTFDLVLCIGVLHHLAKPETGLLNLTNVLNDAGVLFLWLYGEHGGAERKRCKNIVRTLLQGKEDFEKGIQLVKDLEFDKFEFGWNIANTTERERDSLIVDAFMNVNEKLYTCENIHELVSGSGLFAYAISGVTSEDSAYLVDVEIAENIPLNCKAVDVSCYLKTKLLRDQYNSLPILEKYKLIDLFFAPSGYTVIGFTEKSIRLLPEGGRLRNNLVYCK